MSSTTPTTPIDGALALHEEVELPLDRGRTLLALGAAQRRVKRRREARETLEEALAIFERIGAALWADRARGELKRISGRAASPGALTPAEERVAALVAEGKTNREVAARSSLRPHGRRPPLAHLREARDPASRELGPALAAGQTTGGRALKPGGRPFRPSPPLPSLETGGHEGHRRSKEEDDDPENLPHHSSVRRSARSLRAGRARRRLGRRPAEPDDVRRLPRSRRSGSRGAAAARVAIMLDARERASTAGRDELGVPMLEARERAFGTKREVQLTTGVPDVFERAVAARAPAGVASTTSPAMTASGSSPRAHRRPSPSPARAARSSGRRSGSASVSASRSP